MHTPQLADKLRRALLQAAIEGKLSERESGDGHAQELLAAIQAEKAALVKAGRLKKSKGLPEIGEDEKPFAIPENWVWVRLGEIVAVKGGKRIPVGRSLTKENTGHVYIRVSDMKDGSVSLDNLHYVPKDVYPKIQQYIISSEDLYITCAGTIGRVGIIPKELEGANLTENADRLILNTGIKKEWLLHTLNSDLIQTQIRECTTQVGQPKLAIKRIESLQIPLPPLAEQARIVAKLDALLAETDALKVQETALADAQKNFPKMLRASLLQAAVEGKLTERESGDGHAQELLAAIQAEKATPSPALPLQGGGLGRGKGRLKKSKGLPEIGEDEKPFAIPENWAWVRLGEIAQINPRNKADDETVAAFVPMNLLNGGFQNSFSFEERAWKAIKKGYTHFAENDVVIAKITPCFQNRKSAVMRGLPNKIGAGTTELHVLRPYSEKVMPEYLLLIAKNAAFISDGVANFTGTAGQQRVSSTFVENYPIPLPPLAEQARIVAKLDALLAQIESLENLS